MAVYDTGKGFVLPDLRPTSGLAPIDVEYSAVEDALKAYTQVMEKENEKQQQQLDRFTTVFDAVVGHPLDNADQQQRFQQAREKFGLGDDAFGQVSLDMKNPAALVAVESGFRKLGNSREYREIVREQMYAEAFLTGLGAINDPKMRDLAQKDYEKYRQGKIKGFDLNPGQYEPVDFTAEIGKKMGSIPMGIDQTLIQNGTYVQEIKRRAPQALQAVFDYSLKDARIRNSMIAAGYITVDDAGTVAWTPEGEAYKKSLLATYEAEQIKIIQQKQFGGTTGTAAAPGNTFNATSGDYGAYNAVASQVNTYGVDLNNANVQNILRNSVTQDEDPSTTAFLVGIRFGNDPVRAAMDRYMVSPTAAQSFTSPQDFARALATDENMQKEIDQILEDSGYEDEATREVVMQQLIEKAKNYRPPATAPGAAPAAPTFTQDMNTFGVGSPTAQQQQLRATDPSMQPTNIGPYRHGIGTQTPPPAQPTPSPGGGGAGFFS